MDQFSHDLTMALMEETSLLNRASRCGRRRTRSTGNLPCAPQPTEKEDSSSSPTEMVAHANPKNVDGLDMSNIVLPTVSDSDDKELHLPCKILNNAALRLGALESDSLNETFSPARFFKPNARRKRKLKRMSVEYDLGSASNDVQLEPSSLVTNTATATGTIRKRMLKPEPNNRSNLFFCGKRKRSNRDRYHEHDQAKTYSTSTSVPRYAYIEEYRVRPRSYSSTSKPHSDRLLPLNRGLVSKIEKISQLQRTDPVSVTQVVAVEDELINHQPTAETETNTAFSQEQEDKEQTQQKPQQQRDQQQQQQQGRLQIQQQDSFCRGLCKKSNRLRRSQLQQQLQFAVDQHPMDCGELNDFLSSSSLSSSESDDAHAANDTDREGDDELTDWPGNEGGCGQLENKFDPKRKLTKKSNFGQMKSDEGVIAMMAEDDTLMSDSGECLESDVQEALETRYQPSEPITISNKNAGDIANRNISGDINDDISIPFKQIESEMSGETSNPFLSSPPCQPTEVREIRAGCRRVKDERPGFSIKTSVNERLARFLQDPRQTKIRLPDVEIYEHESLINLATLYSLQMTLDNGCAVLTKTSNTTQSVNINQQGLQSRLLFSDFKRRCYDKKGTCLPRK